MFCVSILLLWRSLFFYVSGWHAHVLCSLCPSFVSAVARVWRRDVVGIRICRVASVPFHASLGADGAVGARLARMHVECVNHSSCVCACLSYFT